MLKKPIYQMIINLMRMVILPIFALTIAVIYLNVSFLTMFLVILLINWRLFGQNTYNECIRLIDKNIFVVKDS